MALTSRWSDGRLQFYDGADSEIGGLGIDYGLTNSGALLHGAGTSSSRPTTSTANKNFMSYYLESAATSGTSRGMYLRLYLSAGAGGEALRAFATVSNNTPADTCNGIHSSLGFGSSAGNITGLGTASRNTLHIPNRSLGGTTAAIQAEIYSDGASSALGGTTSYIRCVNDGNATGVAAVDDAAYLFDFAGMTGGAGNTISGDGNEPTWTSKTVLIKCKSEAGLLYLVGVRP